MIVMKHGGWPGMLGITFLICSLYYHQVISAGFACLINPCLYGVCVDSGVNGSAYNCYCIDGYTGIHCQTNWDECWSSPCLNDGICHDGVATFNCTCPEGFSGDQCEDNVNECESNPCLNNGTCIDWDNGFSCQCQMGFTGEYCEIDISVCDETRCLNGGICSEGPGMKFYCQCLRGWKGKTCEIAINECDSAPCKNGGVCVDMHANYACACSVGFTGKDCDVKVQMCTINNCENNALCILEDKNNVCYCVPDYHGDRCQYKYDECQKGPGCLNGGTCIDGVDSYKCSCPTGLTGRFCECVIGNRTQTDCEYTFYNATDIAFTSKTITSTSLLNFSEFYKTNTEDMLTTSPIVSIYTTEYETSEHDLTSSYTIFVTTQDSVSTLTDGLSTSILLTELYRNDSTTTEISPGSTIFGTDRSTTKVINVTEFQISTNEPTIYPAFTTIESTEIMPETSEYTTNTFDATTEYKGTYFTDLPLVTTIDYGITDLDYSTLKSYGTTEFQTFSTTEEFSTRFELETEKETTDMITDKISSSTYSTDDYSTQFEISSTETSTERKDCTIIPCLHGGTCYFSLQVPKCECQFGWAGKWCEEQVGVKIAAFKGNSYLFHIIGNNTGVQVFLTLRTLAQSGLILYARPSPSIYMALYLEMGHLKFQFSCGVQTMLLSELKYPVNTGFPLNLTATIEIEQNGFKQHCPGILKVNNSLAMSGEQTTTKHLIKVKQTGVLYLGGLPIHLLHQLDLPIKNGIIACMESLQINGKSRQIYLDAVDGFEISECSSLACLSSPCEHGGTCVEVAQKWSCLCTNGYTGNNCERSICLNNPCQFGGTCVEYPGSGFICLCPLEKHGLYCEQEFNVGQPFFSPSINGLSSYTAYPLPGAIHHNFQLSFNFIPSTMDQIGLMIFIGQTHPHDSTSDHLAVSFIKGYVVMTWNLGSGPRRIFTPRSISDANLGNEKHTIRLGRTGQYGWLQVDNMPNITGTSPGWLTQLNTQPVIYVGGHKSRNFSGLPHDLPLHTGYVGCLFNLELQSGRVNIPLQSSREATGRNVGQCGTKHCHNSTCHDTGVCLSHGATFTCICNDGWFGPGCTMRYNPCDSTKHKCFEGSTCVPLLNNYECECPLGKSGKYCELDEQLSDISLSGRRSYFSLAPVPLDIAETCIDLEIKPISNRGLILFNEQRDGYTYTFMSLSLHGAVLELRILPLGGQRKSGEILIVRSGRILAMGEWTRVRAGRYGRKIFLWVDGTVNIGTLLPGETLLPSHSPLYIGGMPDLSSLPSGSMANLPVTYYGCVRRLWINRRHVSLDSSHIIEARNINDCDGTACGGDVCNNGGSCWLDTSNTPMCSCLPVCINFKASDENTLTIKSIQHYTGERCETSIPCNQVSCENNGRCVKYNNRLKCQCPIGWTGPYCNLEVPSGSPNFGENSYMVIDQKFGYNKRGSLIPNINRMLSNIYLNFSTAQSDGMIFWTVKEDEYLGVGLESGLIKIVWREKDNKHSSILIPGLLVSDGVWHTVQLSQLEHKLKIKTDAFIIQSYNMTKQITTNGIYYLGGFPDDRHIINGTNGHFNKNFHGCITELALDRNKNINFNQFEGENINSCNQIPN